MRKLTLAILLTAMISTANAGVVEYKSGIHLNKPFQALIYCDDVVRVIEPRMVTMNERITWFNEDISLQAVQWEDFLYVVRKIPGMNLERIRPRHYKVLRVRAENTKLSTLHTTVHTIKPLRTGADYKAKLRQLLTLYATPSNLANIMKGMKWRYMSGGCKPFELNLNRLLPW